MSTANVDRLPFTDSEWILTYDSSVTGTLSATGC